MEGSPKDIKINLTPNRGNITLSSKRRILRSSRDEDEMILSSMKNLEKILESEIDVISKKKEVLEETLSKTKDTLYKLEKEFRLLENFDIDTTEELISSEEMKKVFDESKKDGRRKKRKSKSKRKKKKSKMKSNKKL